MWQCLLPHFCGGIEVAFGASARGDHEIMQRIALMAGLDSSIGMTRPRSALARRVSTGMIRLLHSDCAWGLHF